MPAAEAALGLWLVLGFKPRVAAFVAILTLAAFSGLLIAELNTEHPQPCGCMGPVATANDPATIRRDLIWGLVRNVLLFGGAYYVYLASRPKPAAKPNP